MPTSPTRRVAQTGLLARLLRRPVIWLWAGVAALLAVLTWSSTSVANLERQTAQAALSTLGAELADTCEAQTLRELRGIEQVLNLLVLAGETRPPARLLDELDQRNLLPPPQIYAVRLTPARSDPHSLSTDRELKIVPPRAGQTGLTFVRRLHAASAGWQAEVEVDSRFFVSGFDRTRMGLRGMQGLLAPGGISLVSQSGTQLQIGAVLPEDWRHAAAEARNQLPLATSDGSLRLVWLRPLFGYPLHVYIALDQTEFKAPAEQNITRDRWRIGAFATVVLLVAGLLHRFLSQLQAQRQALEAERQARSREVERLAFRDPLTGLPNRRLFHDTAERELSRSQRYQEPLALLFIDLDGFKAVNDAQGHAAGDELLREVAKRMQACLRSSDLLARLGGDEFAVLLPMKSESPEVGPVAQKLIDALSAPFQLSVGACHISASVGIANCPSDGTELEPLIRHADAAMYEAKRSGKGCWRAAGNSA